MLKIRNDEFWREEVFDSLLSLYGKGVNMDNNVVLTMRGITMTFPGVKALDNVDLTLRKGESMALMGEN